MKINGIYTNRKFENWPSWDVVHEWEEYISKYLNIELINYNKYINKISKIVFNNKIRTRYINDFKQKNLEKVNLAFFMNIYDSRYFMNKDTNTIPIIIDLWGQDIKYFSKIFNKSKLVYVTSMEVYNKIKELNKNLIIKYIPLSISDIWKVKEIDKKIDILQLGRRNDVLHRYAMELTNKFNEIEYIYQTNVDGELHYYSTKNGDLGSFMSRKDYMNLLYQSKISLVSSPGIDNSKDTGGFNPVTPRFYESAINYCYMIGRYPNNDDFKYCNIESICKNVNNYNEFESYVFNFLNSEFDLFQDYDRFLNNHYTSNVAKRILSDLKDIEF